MDIDKEALNEYIEINPASKVRELAYSMVELLTPPQLKALAKGFRTSLQWVGEETPDAEEKPVKSPLNAAERKRTVKPEEEFEIPEELQEDDEDEGEEEEPQVAAPRPKMVTPEEAEEEFNRIIGRKSR